MIKSLSVKCWGVLSQYHLKSAFYPPQRHNLMTMLLLVWRNYCGMFSVADCSPQLKSCVYWLPELVADVAANSGVER